MKAIGKYQLLDEIGGGAAGKTYRARDTFRNRELALKVLDPTLFANAEWKEQFCRELGACSDLRHRHITPIVDLGEVDGAIYVATDLLNGVDLRCHLQERRVLPLVEKLEFMTQVCDGLAHAHSKGIAHGNIKPSNLFVIAGKDPRILDLGLAKCLASVLAAGGKHADLLPNYLAPEQVLGQPFDAKSDVFSVAVVLYELLVQKYPFEAPANLIPREIVHSEPEPLRKLDPKLPEELEQLLGRALKKEPQQRLESADVFAAGLNAIAQKLRGDEASPSSSVATISELPPPVLTVSPRRDTLTPSPAIVVQSAAAPVVVPPVAPVAPPTPAPAISMTPSVAAPSAPPAPAKRPVAAQPRPAKGPDAGAAQVAGRIQKSLPLSRRVLTIAAAAVLAICLIGTILSRQRLHASQARSQSAAVQTQPAVAAPKETPPPAPPASQPVSAAPAAPAHAVSPEEILRGKVKPLWESGKYAQAMSLVNEILIDHPDLSEAQAWKRKIHAAQDAEEAIK